MMELLHFKTLKILGNHSLPNPLYQIPLSTTEGIKIWYKWYKTIFFPAPLSIQAITQYWQNKRETCHDFNPITQQLYLWVFK